MNQGFDPILAQAWLDMTLEISGKIEEIIFEKSFKLPAFKEEQIEIEETVTVGSGLEEGEEYQYELMGEL